MTPEEICREQNKYMPRGVRQTKFGTQNIDAVLMRAPQPNARELSQYDNGKVRYNLPVRVIAMGLCVMGIIAMKVLS